MAPVVAKGYIRYVVRPKSGLPTGTAIRNVALITFDRGETIATDQVDPHDPTQGVDPAKQALVTIDVTAPTSSVMPLPATMNSTQFTVNWSGTDVGAGIFGFDVFVSDNDGPYMPLVTGVADTSVVFQGEVGHHYAFYSVATDHVGNRQPTLSDPQATVTILPAPTISINDASVTEGNVTVGPSAVFVVSLSAPSTQQITVRFATAFGTAGSSDLFSTNGTLTFAPGVTALNLSILTKGETLDEDDETFVVNLTTPVNALITDSQGTATILDNDPVPNMSIGDVTVTEGDTGSVNAVFTVTLSTASGRTVTVEYATANNTATAGNDFTTTSGTLTFTAGQTSKTITVPVLGDTLDEVNETFFVNLVERSQRQPDRRARPGDDHRQRPVGSLAVDRRRDGDRREWRQRQRRVHRDAVGGQRRSK